MKDRLKNIFKQITVADYIAASLVITAAILNWLGYRDNFIFYLIGLLVGGFGSKTHKK